MKSQAEAAAAAIKTGMDNECADFFTITKDDHDYKPSVDVVNRACSPKRISTSLAASLHRRHRMRLWMSGSSGDGSLR